MDSNISLLLTVSVTIGASVCSHVDCDIAFPVAVIAWMCCCWGTKGGGRFVFTFGRSNSAELLSRTIGCSITGSLDTGYVCTSCGKCSYPVKGTCCGSTRSTAYTQDLPTFSVPSEFHKGSVNLL